MGAFRNTAKEKISKTNAIKREFDTSTKTDELIKTKQLFKDKEDREGTKQPQNRYGNDLKRIETHFLIKNLEECLWYDIKKAKTGFVPNHVKLRKTDGSIAQSNERPEVLAQ